MEIEELINPNKVQSDHRESVLRWCQRHELNMELHQNERNAIDTQIKLLYKKKKMIEEEIEHSQQVYDNMIEDTNDWVELQNQNATTQ